MMAGQGIVDIRALVRPPDFDGSENGWKEWAFTFRSFAGLLELGGLLDSAVGAGAWDDGLRDKPRLLNHLLVQLLRGQAAAVARTAERQKGADMWILLKEEFEPRAGGRRSAMLVGILDPKWSGDAATFAADLRE